MTTGSSGRGFRKGLGWVISALGVSYGCTQIVVKLKNKKAGGVKVSLFLPGALGPVSVVSLSGIRLDFLAAWRHQAVGLLTYDSRARV